MATQLLSEYFPIVVFLGIAMGLAVVMVLASYLVAKQKPYGEKVSAYECGFEPFGDARSKFDVRFYLVSILFIIFDLEIAFLFPWAVAFGGLGWVGFDPANRCCPDDRYIRLGSGRNALEAAPIRGVSRGGGEEAMAVSVQVTDAAQAQIQSQQ